MNLPEISENLIEQLNHGNTKAFDKIYHTYYLYLCAIAVYYAVSYTHLTLPTKLEV